jgi:FkbM family methyltransferase
MELLLTLAGKLPKNWLIRATQLRFRYPRIEPLLDWCLDFAMRGRDSVIQRGVGTGLRFNCDHGPISYVFGTHEPGVQHAFERLARPGMVVYDIGANLGFYCVILARLVGDSGRVIAFEPLPDNVRWIAHNATLNGFGQIEVRCEALGRSDSEAEFIVSAKSAWGKLASAGPQPADAIKRINVMLRSLDSLVSAGAVAPPELMKIDVEGAEAEVLNGAAETLRRFRPSLIVDLHGTNAPVAALLDKCAYRPIVLGSPRSILDSPWDACVVAVPAEREDLAAVLRQLDGGSRLDS